MADVREAERLLPGYLKSPEAKAILRWTRIRSPLTRYRRQYLGVVSNGQTEILILFFHADTQVVKDGDWLEGLVLVMGGGNHYFNVTYRVGDRRFSGLAVNAPE